MLLNLDPLLTGHLLAVLDEMGHSDGIAVVDAHFPAAALSARPFIDLPGIGAPRVLKAICSVLPLDDEPALDLMASPGPDLTSVQSDLVATAGLDRGQVRELGRQEFYDEAHAAYVVVRTGEVRPFGNAIVRKGLCPTPAEA